MGVACRQGRAPERGGTTPTLGRSREQLDGDVRLTRIDRDRVSLLVGPQRWAIRDIGPCKIECPGRVVAAAGVELGAVIGERK